MWQIVEHNSHQTIQDGGVQRQDHHLHAQGCRRPDSRQTTWKINRKQVTLWIKHGKLPSAVKTEESGKCVFDIGDPTVCAYATGVDKTGPLTCDCHAGFYCKGRAEMPGSFV